MRAHNALWGVMIAAFVLTLGCFSAGPPAWAGTPLTVLEGVSLRLPPGFSALSPQQIAVKFPNGRPLRYVFANPRQSVSVAVNLTQTPLSPEGVPQMAATLAGVFQRVTPGLQWIHRDIVVLHGVRWARLEFMSRAVDTDIHNEMYLTSSRGRMLGVNFNAVRALAGQSRPALLATRDSLTLRP